MSQINLSGTFGVTQSCRSRYEPGRVVPLQMLLNIAFAEPATSARIVNAVRALRQG